MNFPKESFDALFGELKQILNKIIRAVNTNDEKIADIEIRVCELEKKSSALVSNE